MDSHKAKSQAGLFQMQRALNGDAINMKNDYVGLERLIIMWDYKD